MSYSFIKKSSLLKKIFLFLIRWRIREKFLSIDKYVDKKGVVLDIGAGNCVLCEKMRMNGFNIIPIDVVNNSLVGNVSPKIYNGDVIPFSDKKFDFALLITVLHHIKDPEKIIREAGRVARKIFIIEEVYNTLFQKYITFFIDSVFNFQFRGHPHTNKTDEQWLQVFKRNNLKLVKAEYAKSFFFLHRVMYLLESNL